MHPDHLSIYLFIAQYIVDQGRAPTQYEIATALYWSRPSVQHKLIQMRTDGWITFRDGKRRDIRIVKQLEMHAS